MATRRGLIHFLIVSALLAALVASAPGFASAKPQASDGRSLGSNTQFYVAKPNHGAIEQIADLTSSGDKADAKLIKEMIETPQAVWLTSGTPKSVQQDVKNTVQRAAAKGTVPVLVAYNIPFRDCAQFSAGGATTVQEYQGLDRWLRRWHRQRQRGRDPRARQPWDYPLVQPVRGIPADSRDDPYEWCQPAEANCGDCGHGSLRDAELRGRHAEGQPERQRLPRRHTQRLARFRRCGPPSESRPVSSGQTAST